MERILEVIISIEATQYEYLKFFSADTNKVKFKFIGIDTSNCNATLSVTDSKNNTKEYLVDSSFIFNVPTSLLADRYSCNLKLYNTVNQRVTAYPFYLYIDQDPTPKTPIESDTNYPVLGNLINEVRELESTVNFNENTRNKNEAERISNENTRKANEEKRQAAYKEVTDLRKGVDGKVYKSANDRVNNEVDQLQTQISNASNLPFSGEYISAEHSIKGVCKDMVIKGKTLQNLLYEDRTQWIWVGLTKKTNSDFESTGSVTYPNIIATPPFRLTEGKTYTMLVYVKASIKPINSFITYRIKNQDGASNDLGNLRITELDKLSQGMFLKSSFIASNYNVPHQFEGIQFAVNYSTAEEGKGCLITFKPMLLEGDWTNKVPSYFEGIKSVSETSNKISILSCGKNLNPETQIGNLSTNTGSEIEDINRVRSGFIRVVNGKNYILSLDGVSRPFIKIAYNMNKEFMYKIEDNDSSQFTPTHNGYIRAVRYKDGGTDYQIQCEEGTQATLHEPYREDKRDISLPNGLREWDSIDFNSGEVVVGIEITRMTSNDEISYISELTNTVLFRKAFNLAKDGFSSICNNFKYNLMYTKDEEGHYLSSSSIYIRINKTKLVGYSDSLTNGEKINLFKTWLQANPTTIYFQLAVTTKTKIQGLDALTSHNEMTHIFTNEAGEINPNITCKIPCNTPAVISTLSARNIVLQEENRALNNTLEDNKLNSLATNVDQEYRLLKLEMGV